MNRGALLAVAATAVMVSACASVPRDAGRAEVQKAIAERGLANHLLSPSSVRVEGELTADEAVRVAMANSPRLQIELAELGVARADLIEASTIANPVFEFEIRLPGEPYRPYELRLAQSLIELVQLPRRRAIGRAAFDAAQMRVSSEVLRFASDVRIAYYEVLAATQHAALSRTNASAAQAAAEVAIRQHRAENITDLDLENEQAQYEEAKLDLSLGEQRLLLARESLIRMIGVRETSSEWRVPAAFVELPAVERSPEELGQLAAAQRIDLAIARREVEIARQRIPLSRLGVLEETVLDVHYEREPDGARTMGPGIEFPIPIFNTGRAARTRAEAEFLRARHMLDALTAESSSQLRAAHATVAAARARVEYYRDVILPRRQRIVELTKLEHNAMLAGVFQLLQAKQNEVQAHRDFIDAQREYWSARTSLDRALHGIASDASVTPASDRGQGRGAAIRGGH